MASAMNKKVPAIMNYEVLKISHETIYNEELDFEIKDDDKKKHKDIKQISFEDCFMRKFPHANCLLKIAPNFNHLELHQTNLTRICSEDLRGFEQLVTLYLVQNEIEELPSDLFIHTPNLKLVSFFSNKIKVIGENILEPLESLELFDLGGNPGIDACYSQLSAGNDGYLTLDQFKEATKRCIPAQNAWNTFNELENLKRKFETQKKEIIDLKKLCFNQTVKINEHENLKKEIIDLKKFCVVQGVKIEEQKKANNDIKKHCDELEKKLEKAKLDGAFHKFDFTIKINGKTFKVQKEILAANSPVLADFIRDNEDADELEIELEDFPEDVFEDILNFMVKKSQPKPTANFIEIYAASGFLQMKELMDLCARTLMEKITEENAWEILGLCKKYPNIELGKKALDEMRKTYEKP